MLKRFLLFVFICGVILAAMVTFSLGVARASGNGNTFFGVAAVSDHNVWAVGQFITSTGTAQALIEHWNGHSWQTVPSPAPAGASSSILQGVAAISKDDVWAVGSSFSPGSGQQTLIERWKGAQWQIIPSPVLPETTGSLNGVSTVSDDDVWAVGDYQDSSGFSGTLIEHWNGHIWQIFSSPNPGPQSNFFQGVAAVSAKDAWAVGSFFDTNGAELPLIEHWNGSLWSTVPSAVPGQGIFLQGVAAVSAKDAWAVGNFTDSAGTAQALVEHWDGSIWQAITGLNPAGSGGAFLQAVTAVSHRDVWAAGGAVDPVGNPETLIEHWNGSTWQVVSNPNGGAILSILRGVAAVRHDEDVWAVGGAVDQNSSDVTLTEAWNGAKWRVVPSPTPS